MDGNSLERCALFAREIVEQKLTRVGPLPLEVDREEIYARLDKLPEGSVEVAEVEKPRKEPEPAKGKKG